MKSPSLNAFTLVELIVVITILAILGTIGFLSLVWYSQDARNSSRVSDLRAIQKNLDLNLVSSWFVPLPDDNIEISYSGGIAWNQWYFWESAKSVTKRISNTPTDPSFNTLYTYSVKNNKRDYQISTVFEWRSLFWNNTSPLWDSYALSNNNFESYNLGNFIDPDIVVKNWTNCFIIAAPSIVLSDIPTGWILENNTPYNYSYTNSLHIPSAYSGAIENTSLVAWFQNVEVHSGCNITSMEDLQLYNAKLSTAYQQFANQSKFETLIFNSKSRDFLLSSIESLKERWINVNESVLNELRNPTPDQQFTESFTDTNGTQLVWSHIADVWGAWYNIPGWDSNSYIITGNELVKNDSSTSKVYPRPNPDISSWDYTASLRVNNFAGWTISIYLRYLDNDNYYRVELRSDWYIIYRNRLWTEAEASNTEETILPGSEIIFGVEGDNLNLSIAWNPRWTTVVWGVDGIWYPVLWMENSGARVDNYSLIYK